MSRGAWIAAFAVALLIGTPASAELYRCTRPDGGVFFSDSASACPGSERHEPRGVVQSVGASRAPAAAPARPSSFHEQAEEQLARRWRQKRLAAERELEQLATHEQELRGYVSSCNRGYDLYRTAESGIKQGVPCDRVRDELEKVARRRTDLRAYLEDGLEEECRQAGCLPGWIR